MSNSLKIKRLVTTSVLLALAAVLSLLKVYKLPLGGSITMLSMLPIAILSIKYGAKWGLFSAFVYSLIQLALDISGVMSWGLTAKMWVGCILFDYLLAFTAIGLSGIFTKKGFAGILAGISMALALRFASHVISGSIIFDIWCPEGWNVYLYALAYNGSFMLPELIFTLIGATILFQAPPLKRLIAPETSA